jgi:hypothetical protein
MGIGSLKLARPDPHRALAAQFSGNVDGERSQLKWPAGFTVWMLRHVLCARKTSVVVPRWSMRPQVQTARAPQVASRQLARGLNGVTWLFAEGSRAPEFVR